MKKAFTLIAGIAFVAVLFTSCKKDYTCTCTVTATSTSVPYVYPKTSKKTAKAACDAWTITYSGAATCTLD